MKVPIEIVHELQKRIRIRASAAPETLTRIAAGLRMVPGVTEVRVNSGCSSLVVDYDGQPDMRMTILARAENPLPTTVESPSQASANAKRLIASGAVFMAWFFPAPFARVVTLANVAGILFRGIEAAFAGATKTDVLDALAIGLPAARQEYVTANITRFLIELATYVETTTVHRSDDLLRSLLLQPPEDVQVEGEGHLAHVAHEEVNFIVGHGVEACVGGRSVRLGSRHYLEDDEHVSFSRERALVKAFEAQGKSLLYVAVDDRPLSVFALQDRLREETAPTLETLRSMGVKRLVMIEGDQRAKALALQEALGMDVVFFEQQPEDKAHILAALKQEGCRIAYVGDGVNDGPALMEAHVGVSMPRAADIARATADIVLLEDRLDSLVTILDIAQSTMRIIQSNFRTAVEVNTAILAAAAPGWLPPLSAATEPAKAKVLDKLEAIGIEFNNAQSGGKKISLADLIVLAGSVAVGEAAWKAGYEIEFQILQTYSWGVDHAGSRALGEVAGTAENDPRCPGSGSCSRRNKAQRYRRDQKVYKERNFIDESAHVWAVLAGRKAQSAFLRADHSQGRRSHSASLCLVASVTWSPRPLGFALGLLDLPLEAPHYWPARGVVTTLGHAVSSTR